MFKISEVSTYRGSNMSSTFGRDAGCRFRVLMLDPDLVPCFIEIDHEIISTVIHVLPLIQGG